MRVSLLRRKKESLPRALQKKIKKLDEFRRVKAEMRKECKELKKTVQYRSYVRIVNRLRDVTRRHERLLEVVSNQACEHVPFLDPIDVSGFVSDTDL